MFTLQRGDTPGKGWKMRNVMFMVGKWKKWKKHMRSASPLTNLVDGPGMALNKGFEVQGCANACAWVTLVKAWVSISNFLKYFPWLAVLEEAHSKASCWPSGAGQGPMQKNQHHPSLPKSHLCIHFPMVSLCLQKKAIPLFAKKGKRRSLFQRCTIRIMRGVEAIEESTEWPADLLQQIIPCLLSCCWLWPAGDQELALQGVEACHQGTPRPDH